MSADTILVSHASGLHAVARELARMHEDALRLEDPEDADRSVRLSVLTLVAACTDSASADLAAETVAHLAESHPARALIVMASRDGADAIEADLEIHRGRTSAAAEQVRLTVTGEPSLHLVSIVTPLLLPDVPVYLWMVGAPPLEQALELDAIALCERLIIDTAAYADPASTLSSMARALQPSLTIAVADLAWERTRSWRELIAESFDGVDMRPYVRGIERVSILCSGSVPSAQAWLVAGWMWSRLGWSDDDAPSIRVVGSRASDAPDGDVIAVRIDCAGESGRATIRIERHDDMLYTGLAVGSAISATRTMPVDSPDMVHLVGGLVENTGESPIYRHAVHAAARLAEVSQA